MKIIPPRRAITSDNVDTEYKRNEIETLQDEIYESIRSIHDEVNEKFQVDNQKKLNSEKQKAAMMDFEATTLAKGNAKSSAYTLGKKSTTRPIPETTSSSDPKTSFMAMSDALFMNESALLTQLLSPQNNTSGKFSSNKRKCDIYLNLLIPPYPHWIF
jgi:hypothetical protein